MTQPLLSVQDLSVRFTGEREVRALNGVSFDLAPGESLGLLGESGSGKSVTLRTLLRLHPPARTRIAGSVRVEGQDVLALEGRALARFRGGTVSMVFQEPGLAFDPVCTIGDQMVEMIRAHATVDHATARAQALDMLERVQIPQARRRLDAWPHELSGGMRQRAMIALALCCKPKLLLADEPTTALDATVQIQILLLLRELQRELGMALIFVTHDIGAAVEISDRLAVMYAGRIVEQGPVAQVLAHARHPYTQGLMASSVVGGMRGQPLQAIPGAPPDLASLPSGCAFAPRCSRASAPCREQAPPLATQGAGQAVACWHAGEVDAGGAEPDRQAAAAP
ncbi:MULTISPECIES: ABC transporter ATP-binding protein [Ramlibacter]|uniref:ABC transporter ATP-binding protein n=1 Tax=Ramlibacter aquaticus TaxID=2780094 RepID=A0ABR9SAI5_9BURK|nr:MULTISPECIES: ABC transporter ATP-binding protein [Ramlibacter]MBE7939360.1 ABC transporter ATP-binding protein [Ramlibacter aquaticus]